MSELGSARVVDGLIDEIMLSGVTYPAVRFTLDVITSGPLRLGALMDAIAAKVPAEATGRAFGYPVESATPPCAIVAYPDEPIQFDATFARGSDRLSIPLYIVLGRGPERTTRDALSAVLTGAAGIKDALDGVLTDDQ